jgi:integrase
MKGRVFQRTPGRGKPWSYVVDLPRGADGRRRQRTKGGFATRKLAEAALAELVVDTERGTAVDPQRQTLAEYLTEWLADVEGSLRPSTVRLYRTAVQSWIVPRIGGVRLQDLSPQHLQRLYRELSESGRVDGTGGLSPRSVRLAHQVLHSSLERAEDWRLIARSPASARLQLPRMSRPAMQTWTPEQARRFLAATADDRLAVLWQVLLATGLRRGEVLGLRWDDIDLDARRLRVTQTLVVGDGGEPTLSEPKTAAGRRTVAFHAGLVPALRAHRSRQNEERLLVGSAWSSPDLVFTTAVGTPIHPRNLVREFKTASRSAGLPEIRLHDLRHTAATLALTAGAHPKQVQEMLGHARVAITLDVYSHVTEQMHDETAEKIGNQLFS